MKLISLKKNPNIKINKDIIYYLNPDFVYLPGSNIQVSQDEQVLKGEKVCSNYASPISGIAFGIKKCLFNKKVQNSLVIENDFRELEDSKEHHYNKITIKNILKCLEENKDKDLLAKFKSQTTFSNIVITTIDDEPYVYNNIFILKENIAELLELIDELGVIYKSNHNYLVVKNIDTAIITDCLNAIGTYPSINLTLVNDEYLLGNVEFILEKLQIKDKTLYLTTSELLKLNNYLKGKDTSTILLTISGDAIKESKILRIKKYTLLKDILSKYFTITVSKYKIIANGLMQGFEITDEFNFVIDESISSINIMASVDIPKSNCINCGKCIEICPKGVNPLTKKNINKCINCGLCSYICPGYVNLKAKLQGDKDV